MIEDDDENEIEDEQARRANPRPPMNTHFDHEKLDVYQLDLRFITWVTALLAAIKQRPTTARAGEVSDQLDRASLSALLNTAEGNGKRQGQARAKFFDDARGSATECAACLDALVAKGICPIEQIEEGKIILVRIASMLSKLVARFNSSSSFSSSSSIIREEPDGGEEFEVEGENDDDEHEGTQP